MYNYLGGIDIALFPGYRASYDRASYDGGGVQATGSGASRGTTTSR